MSSCQGSNVESFQWKGCDYVWMATTNRLWWLNMVYPKDKIFCWENFQRKGHYKGLTMCLSHFLTLRKQYDLDLVEQANSEYQHLTLILSRIRNWVQRLGLQISLARVPSQLNSKTQSLIFLHSCSLKLIKFSIKISKEKTSQMSAIWKS